ncbi:MAG: hypothetical protein ACK6C0_00840 [Betaproteobacteria bacterium]|jgi:hypothetical protein
MTTHHRRRPERAPPRAVAALLALALLGGCATQIGPAPANADGLGGGKALLIQNKSLTPVEGGRVALAADLLPGDILLSASAGLVSVGIRALTVSPVSHAALYVGNGEVAEAVRSGVQLRRIEVVLAEESVVVALRHPALDATTAERIGEFARAAVGGRYDTVGVLLHAPFSLQRRACELPGLTSFLREACLSALATLQLGGGSNDRFFCSEFVLAAYAQAGLPITRERPHWVSPEDLLHMRAGDVSSLPVEQPLAYVGHLKVAAGDIALPLPATPQGWIGSAAARLPGRQRCRQHQHLHPAEDAVDVHVRQLRLDHDAGGVQLGEHRLEFGARSEGFGRRIGIDGLLQRLLQPVDRGLGGRVAVLHRHPHQPRVVRQPGESGCLFGRRGAVHARIASHGLAPCSFKSATEGTPCTRKGFGVSASLLHATLDEPQRRCSLGTTWDTDGHAWANRMHRRAWS